MLFGDEDKENSTASWDYETETEPINTEFNSTNEKGLFDAIKDSLNYVDGNKQSTEQQTDIPNQTDLLASNIPSYNVSSDDAEEEDDEEISLLDFFLKGESAFTPTTEPFVFNITGKPLLNGMTNSPMQIQPILPDNMKNESLQFSMLPMSLYNMVKDDGSLVFNDDKISETPSLKLSHPLEKTSVTVPPHSIINTQSKVITQKNEFIPTSTVKSVKTTHKPKQTTKITTTTYKIIETTTLPTKVKTQNKLSEMHVTKGNLSTENVNKTNYVHNVGNATEKIPQKMTIVKHTTSTTKQKTSYSSSGLNTTKAHVSTTEHATMPSTTTKLPPKITTTAPKSTITLIKNVTRAPPTESTTVSVQILTTKSGQTTNVLPKITAVQVNSNPSILETDINYDYGEPTLPPSLPNLKIIPFLPTDAVKNVLHKNDGFKSNYNYYQPSSSSSSSSYVDSAAHVSNTAPFSISPSVEKYPLYQTNVADDRIDYDSYKVPSENADGLDYINVYAGSGNLVQPATFEMSVNSKLDYESNDKKVIPSKFSTTSKQNLTVKPPLPPFEPEHEYNLYNIPPQSQVQSVDIYNEYNINAPHLNEAFSSEHNYNVPHFVTMPPNEEPLPRPINHKESIFSHGNKNQFIPPAKTEGKHDSFKKSNISKIKSLDYISGIRWIRTKETINRQLHSITWNKLLRGSSGHQIIFIQFTE